MNRRAWVVSVVLVVAVCVACVVRGFHLAAARAVSDVFARGRSGFYDAAKRAHVVSHGER